jgi:hypothetical protein
MMTDSGRLGRYRHYRGTVKVGGGTNRGDQVNVITFGNWRGAAMTNGSGRLDCPPPVESKRVAPQ